MNRHLLELNNEELDHIQTLVSVALKTYNHFDDEEFLKDLPMLAYQLPKRLLRFLNEFKYNPPEQGYGVISNNLLDVGSLGRTPTHWQLDTNNDTCKPTVMSMCMCAGILGDAMGWLTQQDGRMIHDVLPIKEHENEQLGCGSKEKLWWHSEDAFHDYRADYLMLMCLRNPDNIPTIIGKPDLTRLSREHIDVLFQRRFPIRPDYSHSPKNESDKRSLKRKAADDSKVSHAYEAMVQRNSKPEKIAVLFGSRNNPHIRIDPYFMEEPDSLEAKQALDALIQLVEDSLVEVSLKQGDCIILDNYRVVHGRAAFTARYDGNDRWLKRMNIIRDIRKCDEVLDSTLSRIIF